MLVLTRRAGEGIVIGEKIEVTVLEVRGSQVRIGIEAPLDIPIYRKELYLDIVVANKQAVLVDRQRLKKLLSGMMKTDQAGKGVLGPTEAVGKGDEKDGKVD